MQTRKGLSREEREDKVEQLLEEFNITHIRDSLGQSLGWGAAPGGNRPGAGGRAEIHSAR